MLRLPLIPLGVVMRAVIVPLIPSLVKHDAWDDEDRPTVVVPRLPGKF